MDKLVVPLLAADNVGMAGGKGASLAKMISAGFDVPPGFVVTTAAKVMTDKLESQILTQFDELDAKYVAVRSSAAAEDGANDAWAGQLDTFLNVNRGDLIEKLKLCWESANSDRAKSYAKQKGLQSGGVAVVVQAMIQGDTSGIAFSVNPLSKNTSDMIIEAGFGLNEPIVSGEITPDTYIIDKKSLGILQKHISDQTKKLVQGKNGENEWRQIENSNQQKLSDEQIKSLSETVIKLEEFFGYPIDSEWTFAGDKLYILQARPITTLG